MPMFVLYAMVVAAVAIVLAAMALAMFRGRD